MLTWAFPADFFAIFRTPGRSPWIAAICHTLYEDKAVLHVNTESQWYKTRMFLLLIMTTFNFSCSFLLRLRGLETELAADVGPFLSRMFYMYIQQLVYHLFSVKQRTPVWICSYQNSQTLALTLLGGFKKGIIPPKLLFSYSSEFQEFGSRWLSWPKEKMTSQRENEIICGISQVLWVASENS